MDRFFAETGIPVTAAELRRRIEDRIEADLELLEALDGDPEAEPSLGATEALALCGPAAADLKARQRHDWDDQTYWGRSSATDGERDAGEEPEEENEHGGDIQDEPHDPQPDDITRWMHGYDPAVAAGARAARRQAEAMRARKNREARL
ncbi:hypothetical protein MKL09_08870 [Methylobacterium sp. J-048]|uniref:hypothetical protein n=1 Tax=Methylobacterium sp. J-048 TaxID=2836635 RepID=UPI001FBB9C16|nr:hypothetical protein [Methylobacterium sp. J-048]MCJ2056666.1 hypothetical protein [Methylobacterium sp. J-048]